MGAMTSFAFNTMIGQVTPIAVSSIGWRFYVIFIVFNLSSAAFFWAFLPETKVCFLFKPDVMCFEGNANMVLGTEPGGYGRVVS